MANLKEIQEFLENISKTDLYKVKIKTDEIEMTVQLKPEVKISSEAVQTISQPVVSLAPQQTEQKQKTEISPNQSNETDGYITIKSPMVGTFYRKPNPESPSFAEIGQQVKVGDVLCIVEAMKLFNEIESDVSGEIVKILLEDASPVEYDQPLFLIKPM